MSEQDNTIEITEEMYIEAKQKAQEMIDNGSYNKTYINETDKEKIEYALIDCIGKVAFKTMCNNIGIEAIPGTYSDNDDFSINGFRIDVRTVRTDSYPKGNWTYDYPVEQHPENKDSIVIGIYSPKNNTVLFWGLIDGCDVTQYETTAISNNQSCSKNYSIPYKALIIDPAYIISINY